MSATGPQNADGPQGPISDPRGSCKVHKVGVLVLGPVHLLRGVGSQAMGT